MKIFNFPQGSPEWHELKRGNIGGTRFGAVISGKKNQLVYELLNERLSPWMDPVDLSFSEDVQFGNDNEPIARELYSKQTGIQFEEVGAIISDYSGIHHHSPDGITPDRSIVLEIKSTRNGHKHLKRFFEGVDKEHISQCINAFAVSDEVKEVHWISFCPERFERPIVAFILTREMFKVEIESGRTKIKQLEADINKMESEFTS